MKFSFKTFGLLSAVVVLAACSSVPDVPTASADFVKVNHGVLTTTYGKTMYTYDNDQAGSGKSACVQTCADNWPPVYVEPGIKLSGDFSYITRNDGQKQLTYKGKPLYLYAKDQAPGDQKGNGLNGVWHTAAQ